MTSKSLLALAVILIITIQAITAKAKPKALEKSQLESLAADVQSLVNNVTTSMGFKDLPDSKKIVQVLNQQTQLFADNVQKVADKLKGEIKAHQGEADNVVKSVQATLTETATSLQKIAGPDATTKAKEIKASFDSGLKTVIEQTDKLIKSIEPDMTKMGTDVKNVSKTLLDYITEASNNLQKQLNAQVVEHEKTHKH